jgi:hypothetical protein
MRERIHRIPAEIQQDRSFNARPACQLEQGIHITTVR